MNKRLRKKKHLGEFSQMGFTVECKLKPDDSDLDRFIDDLIEFVEARKLEVGGGGCAQRFGGVVASETRYGSATQADIGAMKDWLEHQRDVLTFEVSGLWDVWYGEDPLNKAAARTPQRSVAL